MTLVADSGSTKTDWMIVPTLESFQTQGVNPVLMSEEHIVGILQQEVLPQLQQMLSKDSAASGLQVFFYGAGVRPDMVQKMERAFLSTITSQPSPLTSHLSTVNCKLSFASDLLGAARALCGHNEGIACILGTGSNSCLFDGDQIVKNTPALGYILGDEGGGAALGKRFLNALLKGLLPAEMRDDYLSATRLTLDDIIRKVYREPMANRFLASTSLYISQHIDNEAVHTLVVDNFRQFFRHNILPYNRQDLPVSFVGSIASHYEPLLRKAAEAEGFLLGEVLQSPIRNLCKYHLT